MEYRGKYLIIGPPGTGKTYRVAASVKRVCETSAGQSVPCVVASLTRTAAREAAGRISSLPAHAVGTLHSHAYHALDQPVIAETKAAEFNDQHPTLAISVTGKQTTDDPLGDGYTGPLPGDPLIAAYSCRRARCVTVDPASVDPLLSRFIRAWCTWKNENDYLDFTDLIETAARDTTSAPGAPGVILVDEAQDCSELELQLVARWGESADATILVGDPDQALYEWRGAHPELFADPDVPGDHRDVLGQSYRVPRAVHAAAWRWREHLSAPLPIEYLPRDADGGVSSSPATWQAPADLLVDVNKKVSNGETVMILGTCGYHLDPTVKMLREAGVPFSNPWRVANGKWNPLAHRKGRSSGDRLLAFLCPDGVSRPVEGAPVDDLDSFEFGANVTPIGWTQAALYAWADVLEAKGTLLPGTKTHLRALAVGDTAERVVTADGLAMHFEDHALPFLCRMLAGEVGDVEAVNWLRQRVLKSRDKALQYPARVLEQRGSEALTSRPRVYVGTIHSFKGSEADHVYLFPDLSPRGCGAWNNLDTRDTVVRCIYVGMTRARQTLTICRAQVKAMSAPIKIGEEFA